MASTIEIIFKARDEASKKFKDMQNQSNTLTGVIARNNRKIGLGIIAVGAVAAGAGIISLKLAANFEGAMREVNSLIGLSEDKFKKLSNEVLQAAKDVGKAPTEMARALYQVVSAGVPAGEALEFLKTSARTAIAGVTDTTTAVDGLTTVLNAFHMEASETQHVADVMFTTVKGGKTTFKELAASMFNVAPLAAATNIKFETVAAALATMTKQGIPTTQATTQLRMAMVSLQKPTETMKAQMKGLGYESGEAMIAELGFAETLHVLRKAGDASKEGLMKMFESIEGAQAVLALTGTNASAFATDLAAVGKASEGAGAMTIAYNEINKGAGRGFERLTSQVKGTAIGLGNVLLPTVITLVGTAANVLGYLSGLLERVPILKHAIAALTIAAVLILIPLGAAILFLPQLIALQVLWQKRTIQNALATKQHTAALWAKTAAMKAWAATAWLAHAASGKLNLGLLTLGRSFVVAGLHAMKSAAGFVVAAGAKIWAWASTVPFIGIGLAIAGVAALAGSIIGLKRLAGSFDYGGTVPGPPGRAVQVTAFGGEWFAGKKPSPSLLGGGGPTHVHVTLEGGTYLLWDQDDVDRLAETLAPALARYGRRG